MAITYHIHPEHPQVNKIDKVVEELRDGAIMLYPTDTVWALGCDLNSKNAIERIRVMKKISNDKPLTFLCPSLANISQYAHVSDQAYRIIKHLIPGTYTFILPAAKLVPKLVQNPKRKTCGIRVPDHRICQVLLERLDNPIVSMSAQLPFDTEIETMEDLFVNYDKLIDVIIDDHSSYRTALSTIIDMSADEFRIERKGLGLEKALQYL